MDADDDDVDDDDDDDTNNEQKILSKRIGMYWQQE